jgi:phospholipid transport system transporter-binding protein
MRSSSGSKPKTGAMAPGNEPEPVTQPRAELLSQGDGHWILSGNLLFETSAQLLAEGEAAFGTAPRVEIDLSRIGRMDSAGLALLLEWSIAARAGGRVVVYRNPPAVLGALAGISDVAEFVTGGA